MSKTVDLGPVSAYALAVKHGYIGTEAEWVTEMENKRNDAVAAAVSATASETSSANSAIAAANSASDAASDAVASANRAIKSESYAVGGTGTRQNEDADNAAYYYDQVKRISQGLQGGLMPMGTITFTQLSLTTAQTGYMYNISDAFVTDGTFNEGAGHDYPAGTNVYWTADGMWDCFAGTAVGGVKGAKENTYRQGLVDITPKNIGALPEDGDSKDTSVSFVSNDTESATEWTDVNVLSSGEKHASIFNKVSTMFKNMRYLYKMLGTTDISAIGDGTVTGALVSQNHTLNDRLTWKVIDISLTSPLVAWTSIQISCPVIKGAKEAMLYDITSSSWTQSIQNVPNTHNQVWYTNGFGFGDGYMVSQKIAIDFYTGIVINTSARGMTSTGNPPNFTKIAYR